MRIIFFQPNNRLFRKDGSEFTARAKDCRDFWTGQGHEVKMCPLPKANDANKRQFVYGVLDAQEKYSVDRIAVFGHGTSTWCDLGFKVGDMMTLIQKMVTVLATENVRIALYCCLTGKADRGFANVLSMATGAVVMAHTTSGHTTRNPFKRMFFGGDNYRDMWPKDKASFRAWQKDLQTDNYVPFIALEADVLKAWVQG